MRSSLRTGMTLIVILLIFLAFNLVWARKIPDIQWDFSQKKTHTLSSSAQHLAESLEGPVDLYYFNANNDAKKSVALKRYGKRIEDILKQYEKAAKGMINLHLIEPRPFSEDAYKAELFGLDNTTGFIGLIGTRAGQGAQRIESFSFDNEPLIEYEIGHLIYKLQQRERPAIGLLTGLALGDSADGLLKGLHQHFSLVNLQANTERVPEQVKTLMLVHPATLSERALYAVEQFVLRGGKLMMFIDPVSEQSSSATPPNSRLDDMLAAWGIQMAADKLLVDNLYAASVTPGAGHSPVRHPARLNLPRQAMNAGDVSAWTLRTVTVSSSGALNHLKNSRTTVTPLLQSSMRSALLETSRFTSAAAFDLLADEAPSPGQPHVIAARIQGPSYSVFPNGIRSQPPGLQKAAQIHVVVVADTDVLTDQVSSATSGDNQRFVLNTLDNLAARAELSAIRPRVAVRPALNPLHSMREAAALTYSEQASELERRLQRTEQEWQLRRPEAITLGTQAVDTDTQLQALNKERLRLPMELHALKAQAFAQVNRLERTLKLGLILAVPLVMCLIAWVVFLWERRRRAWPGLMVH